jgi:hypothetical protein
MSSNEADAAPHYGPSRALGIAEPARSSDTVGWRLLDGGTRVGLSTLLHRLA